MAALEIRSVNGDDEDLHGESESDVSSVYHAGSVISTIPDRHGFLGGSQYSPER